MNDENKQETEIKIGRVERDLTLFTEKWASL